MEVVVIGCGVSGVAAARLAKKCGYSVRIVDEFCSDAMFAKQRELEAEDLVVELGIPHCDFSSAMMIIQSPGVKPESSLACCAVESGVEVISEIEFAAMNTDIPMLAVTGTNGKTTTTELTTHILISLGYNVAAVGNIGETFSDAVASGVDYDFFVVEVSSFQLEKSPQFNPLTAVVTNIAEDHLDRHGSMENYTKTKFSLFNNVANEDAMIINENLFALWNESYSEHTLPTLFSVDSEADFRVLDKKIVFNDRPVISVESLSLKGRHNVENTLAALALVKAACGEEVLFSESLQRSLCTFNPGDHRIAFISEKNGVSYYNDSKGTNPAAVCAALEAVGASHNVCLILGGLDKGMDFSSLESCSSFIKKTFIIGECRQKIADTVKEFAEYELFDSFEKAVVATSRDAVAGDVVLLSPGCASMDMFANYKERGNLFVEMVNSVL